MRQSWRVPETPRKPRVAILILAHAYPTLLDSLVRRLSPDFDIYLHLDRATDITLESFAWAETVTTVKSRRTYWGSFHCTLAILDLLRTAHARGYDRYVLISGQDVPLVSNSDIVEHFALHPEQDFIQSLPLPSPRLNGGIERITRAYWHAPYRHTGRRRLGYNVVEYGLELGYRTVLQPKIIVGQFYWGETWFGLTHSSVEAIFAYLRENPDFIKLFRGSRLGEELFLQTLVRRVSPKANLAEDTITYVDWKSGPEKPRVLDASDLPSLEKTPHLFARKVHPEKSKELLGELERGRSSSAVRKPRGS